MKGIIIKNKNNIKKSEIKSDIKISSSFISDIINDTTQEYKKYANINGFRKGNAPDKLIFKKYKDKILSDTYKQLKEDIETEIYKEEKSTIKVIFNNEFKDLIDKNTDIITNITMYIKPKIKTVNIKKINISKKKIEDEFRKQRDNYSKEEKVQIDKNKDKFIEQIYNNIILENINNEINLNRDDVPSFIIDNAINYSLDKIDEFTKSINIDTDTYFKQINKSREEVIKQIEEDAIDQFKFDLFIEDYVTNNKIEVTKEDIDNKLKDIDPKTLPQINTNSIINDIIYDKAINNIIENVKANAINTNSN